MFYLHASEDNSVCTPRPLMRMYMHVFRNDTLDFLTKASANYLRHIANIQKIV